MGKLRKRMSFSRIDEVLDMPNLIEVQKNSYRRFLEEDFREVLNDVSPITDYSENLVLEFVDYALDKTPKHSVERCKERDLTYAAPLKVFVRLKNKETGEIKESEVFMGDFPLMTEHGTFIINGAERVIVSQLVRSPGVYFTKQIDKAGKQLFSGQVIPNRGAWIEYETDSNDGLWVRIDRARKLPVTVILRALGYGTDEQLIELLGHVGAVGLVQRALGVAVQARPGRHQHPIDDGDADTEPEGPQPPAGQRVVEFTNAVPFVAGGFDAGDVVGFTRGHLGPPVRGASGRGG